MTSAIGFPDVHPRSTPVAGTPRQPLSIVVLGTSLSMFLTISYLLCIALGLVAPGWGVHQAWLQFLPGFTWLTWPSFLLGLVESVAYGWYVALLFVPLFNAVDARLSPGGR
jgi:hypothetical protein